LAEQAKHTETGPLPASLRSRVIPIGHGDYLGFELNEERVNSLLTLLDVASRCDSVANLSKVPEIVSRNREDLQRAHEAAMQLMKKVTLDGAQRQVIAAKLAVLRRKS
jgi:hypothetical protein